MWGGRRQGEGVSNLLSHQIGKELPNIETFLNFIVYMFVCVYIEMVCTYICVYIYLVYIYIH